MQLNGETSRGQAVVEPGFEPDNESERNGVVSTQVSAEFGVPTSQPAAGNGSSPRHNINPNTFFAHQVADQLAGLRQGLALTMGRSNGADICVLDPKVSWEHLRLVRVGRGIEITDLGSTNGTFIHDPWTNERVKLEPHVPLVLKAEMRVSLGNHSGASQFIIP
jgi:hypothetical protein